MDITFKSLPVFGQACGNQRARFKAGYADTLRLLDRELRHLGARNIVVQMGLSGRDIRLDGMPRAGARPNHPGVILSFDSKHGPLNYPCGRFSEWEDNLRAIALSLEHLRTVDRYGVTKRGEQYSGWKALAPPNGKMDVEEAWKALAELAGVRAETKTGADMEELYRVAAMKHHPDRGGKHEDFARLTKAMESLRS
jgi:hypothetical protein